MNIPLLVVEPGRWVTEPAEVVPEDIELRLLLTEVLATRSPMTRWRYVRGWVMTEWGARCVAAIVPEASLIASLRRRKPRDSTPRRTAR